MKEKSNDVTPVEKKIPAASLGDTKETSDPVTIENVTIDGNIMTLDVSYSGGCQEHWFDLIGSFAVMKSLPPKRSVKLIHNAKDDRCRKMISESISFDISELAMQQKPDSEIVLLIDGYKEPITYKYQ